MATRTSGAAAGALAQTLSYGDMLSVRLDASFLALPRPVADEAKAARTVKPIPEPAVGPGARDERYTSVIPVRYRRSDRPSRVDRQMQSKGECVANGRIDLTGHVILIVEEQPIVALNMQIAAEEAGGEAIIARGPNEALAQLHQFMVSVAVIDPRQHALISELQLRRIRIVLKAGTTCEVLARLVCVE